MAAKSIFAFHALQFALCIFVATQSQAHVVAPFQPDFKIGSNKLAPDPAVFFTATCDIVGYAAANTTSYSIEFRSASCMDKESIELLATFEIKGISI